MAQDEKREQVIQNIADMLRTNPFTFEFKVRKNPKGIKVICEVTQEHMDAMIKKASEEHKANKGQ